MIGKDHAHCNRASRQLTASATAPSLDREPFVRPMPSITSSDESSHASNLCVASRHFQISCMAKAVSPRDIRIRDVFLRLPYSSAVGNCIAVSIFITLAINHPYHFALRIALYSSDLSHSTVSRSNCSTLLHLDHFTLWIHLAPFLNPAFYFIFYLWMLTDRLIWLI